MKSQVLICIVIVLTLAAGAPQYFPPAIPSQAFVNPGYPTGLPYTDTIFTPFVRVGEGKWKIIFIHMHFVLINFIFVTVISNGIARLIQGFR